MVSKTYDYIKKSSYRNVPPKKAQRLYHHLMKFESVHIVKLVEKCWKGYEKKGTKNDVW